MSNKNTKIVATIGPASDSPEVMKELILAGVNVFRFNMKHNTVAWHQERIARAAQIAADMGKKVGIFIDLQGPEIRIETRNAQEVTVQKGEMVIFGESFDGSEVLVCIPHPEVFKLLELGDNILIDDGFLEFKIVDKKENVLVGEAKDNYVIKNRKGMNLPGKPIDLPSLIAEDLEKLDMATTSKVDFVALSFCRRKSDIEILHGELDKRNLKVGVIAKIESQEALDNIEAIIEVADAVMIARGDLGIEVPIEQLAFLQKQMITMCRKARKPVIVATQMLQSMAENPRPTRAEATDVSNAVWDGTDAVMLSGETAAGNYPVAAVEAMNKIVSFNETKATVPEMAIKVEDSTAAITSAAYQMVKNYPQMDIKEIVVFTETGYTAKTLSALRPNISIIAVTNNNQTAESLTLSYGVETLITEFPEGKFEISEAILEMMKQSNLVKNGDMVLVVHGSHWNNPNMTNSLALIKV